MAAVSIPRSRLFIEPNRRVIRESPLDAQEKAREDFQPLLDVLHTSRKCLMCRRHYLPATNLLRRECWIHTGHIVLTRGYPMYTCCGFHANSMGCTSSMHVWQQESLDFLVDNWWRAALLIPREVFDFNLIPFSKEIVSNWNSPEPAPSSDGDDRRYEGTQLYYRISQVALITPINYSY